MSAKPNRIAIVVGEASGDTLGAGLISALKARFPDCHFEGIGGPKMLALGFESHFEMDRLAVMGLIDPLKRLPELLGIRRQLRERYRSNPPDVFIGIDAPDFNLDLELGLRKAGVKTAHYVSPSVWAWRQGRIKKIAKAIDLMLCLLPFEADFYREHQVPVEFVGHPLADTIPMEDQQAEARGALGLALDTPTLALLPGSRRSEVERLLPVFLEAAKALKHSIPTLQCVIPSANAARQTQIEECLATQPQVSVHVFAGQSHELMAAADAVLMASGTTTLEALLLKRPMVITYKMSGFSFWLMKRLAKIRFVGLPNLLADRQIVPELLQDEATAEAIRAALLPMLTDNATRESLRDTFDQIHVSLRRGASERAAEAISRLLET